MNLLTCQLKGILQLLHALEEKKNHQTFLLVIFCLDLTQLPLILNLFTLIYILPSSLYGPFPSSKFGDSLFFPEFSLCPEVPPILSCLAVGRSALCCTSHSHPSSHIVYKHPTAGSMNLRALTLLSLAVAAICICAKCPLLLSVSDKSSGYVCLIHVLKV